MLLTNVRNHSHPTVGASWVRVRRVVMLGARSERPFEGGLREGSCQTVVVFLKYRRGKCFMRKRLSTATGENTIQILVEVIPASLERSRGQVPNQPTT